VVLQRTTQAVANAIEDMIATAPDQWYSFKPIWPASQAEKDDLARRADASSERLAC
jgi:lauroyl/myristoyl acyltransferase